MKLIQNRVNIIIKIKNLKVNIFPFRRLAVNREG